jgi:hypothetical protein
MAKAYTHIKYGTIDIEYARTICDCLVTLYPNHFARMVKDAVVKFDDSIFRANISDVKIDHDILFCSSEKTISIPIVQATNEKKELLRSRCRPKYEVFESSSNYSLLKSSFLKNHPEYAPANLEIDHFSCSFKRKSTKIDFNDYFALCKKKNSDQYLFFYDSSNFSKLHIMNIIKHVFLAK